MTFNYVWEVSSGCNFGQVENGRDYRGNKVHEGKCWHQKELDMLGLGPYPSQLMPGGGGLRMVDDLGEPFEVKAERAEATAMATPTPRGE